MTATLPLTYLTVDLPGNDSYDHTLNIRLIMCTYHREVVPPAISRIQQSR